MILLSHQLPNGGFNSTPPDSALGNQVLESTGITNYRIEVLHDSGISGERIYRPGINKVREGIESRKWHLILVEDCSRLFRVEYAAGMLFASAVDKRI